eukprot:TRINITY_DN4179_c0_g1_i1.p1 TRINITY_DN4179_c0_g1~~TRINITY_DN4179_c0_g1_i1.p1  ORF type:complete len:1260 (-),score=236.79 TRINITY_DN4179_c0_g1_i1:84-3863(-)
MSNSPQACVTEGCVCLKFELQKPDYCSCTHHKEQHRKQPPPIPQRRPTTSLIQPIDKINDHNSMSMSSLSTNRNQSPKKPTLASQGRTATQANIFPQSVKSSMNQILHRKSSKSYILRNPTEIKEDGPRVKNVVTTDVQNRLKLKIPVEIGNIGGLSDLKDYVEQEPLIVTRLDEDNRTLLHLASARGDENIVNYLVAEKHVNIESLDNKNFSPFLSAAQAGQLKCCLVLWRHGASVHKPTTSGELPLHFLVQYPSPEQEIHLNQDEPYLLWTKMITLVLSQMRDENCNINFQTYIRLDTPLHYATQVWPKKSVAILTASVLALRTFILNFLLKNAADPSIQNSTGRPALEYLFQNGYQNELKEIGQGHAQHVQAIIAKISAPPAQRPKRDIRQRHSMMMPHKEPVVRPKNNYRAGLAKLLKEGRLESNEEEPSEKGSGSGIYSQLANEGPSHSLLPSYISSFALPVSRPLAPLSPVTRASVLKESPTQELSGLLGSVLQSESPPESPRSPKAETPPTSPRPNAPTGQKIARALYNFNGQTSEELCFEKDEQLLLLDQETSQTWWYAENLATGEQGWFPSNFVNVVSWKNYLMEHDQRQISPSPSAALALQYPHLHRRDSIMNEVQEYEMETRSGAFETVDLLRFLSDVLDSLQVDRANAPLLVQAKNTVSLAISAATELEKQAMMYALTKVKAVVVMQSCARRFLAVRRYQSLMRSFKLPKGPSEELFMTELKYVEHLTILKEKFVTPVLAKNIIKPGEELHTLFGSVEVIINTNSKLLANLREYFALPICKRHLHVPLGQIFLNMAPYFSVYAIYVANYDPNAIEKFRQENKAFDMLWKKFNAEMKPQTISDYLAKPYQRSLKYPLLLEEIVKNLPEDHVELESMQKASLELKLLARKWNEKKRRAENQQQIVSIQLSLDGIDFDLVEPSRELIRRDSVTLLKLKGIVFGTKLETVHSSLGSSPQSSMEALPILKEMGGGETLLLFLFNDLLVLAAPITPRSRSMSQSGHGNLSARPSVLSTSVGASSLPRAVRSLMYRGATRLAHLKAFDLPDFPSSKNLVQVVYRSTTRTRYKSLTLAFGSEVVKGEWLADLRTHVMAELANPRNQSTSGSNSPGSEGQTTMAHERAPSVGQPTSPLAFDLDPNEPLFPVKEGRLSTRSFFSWRPRYVVLQNTSLSLYVAENKKCCGHRELNSKWVLKLPAPHKLVFHLIDSHSDSDQMHFKADNIQDYDSWVSAFKTLLTSLRAISASMVLDSS